MPPPPGIIFPPGIPPATSPAAAPSLTSTEEIWVENKSPEGKVLCLVSSLYTLNRPVSYMLARLYTNIYYIRLNVRAVFIVYSLIYFFF